MPWQIRRSCGGGLILCIAPMEPPIRASLKDKLSVSLKNDEVGLDFGQIWSSIKAESYFKKLSLNIYLSKLGLSADLVLLPVHLMETQKDYFSQIQAKQFIFSKF